MTNSSATKVQQVLGLLQKDGLLSRSLKGFESRPQQQEMMQNVLEAYLHDRISLIEAGTGTGKSLAYLIPALIWAANHNERTVISTNTINLQEQLLHKDIPFLLKTLNLELKVVLVKGMGNYLCLRKFEDERMTFPLFHREEDEEMDRIATWSKTTKEGSRSELPFIPSAATWERVGAENEACPKNDCPYFQECFFFKARRQAAEAHILIVNHHLLFADLMMRAEKRAENRDGNETSILPSYKRIILDEAHHIEDIATEHFAARLHRLELSRSLGKLSSDKLPIQGKLPLLKEKLQSIFSKSPSSEIYQILQKLTVELPAFRHQLQEKIFHVFDLFSHFIDQIKNPNKTTTEDAGSFNEKKLRILKEHQSHPKWKEELIPEVKQLIDLLKGYHGILQGIEIELKFIENDRLQEQTKSVRCDIQAISLHFETSVRVLQNFVSEASNANRVRWIESHHLKALTNVHLIEAELDISQALVDFLFSQFSTIILCSATLAANKKFGFIRDRLGLNNPMLAKKSITEHVYDSPFDYQKQALLAVPIDIPPPGHEDFNEIAYENIWKAIEVSHGQAFVLFTSYQMLKSCSEILSKRLQENRYPLFKQGDDNRRTLVEKFKKTPRAVLFGTDSFWEGVDVIGEALRCVIIVKLPFKVPSEPIIQARTEAIIERGGDPFYEFAIPQAIVKFKQGFGRLIRHKWDRGCIICLDNRLALKGYGRLFLNSLPPCEKIFMNGSALWPKIAQFYRQTYHLTKSHPFS